MIPAVDINSGKTIAFTNCMPYVREVVDVVWQDKIRLACAMRASYSVPAVFEPKTIGSMCLVDGGITNVLPVDLLIASGEKTVIGVDISNKYEGPNNINMIEVAASSFSVMSACLKELTSMGEKCCC